MERPKVIIGTGKECDLQLNDPAISRQHLEIQTTERGYWIRDIGSTNGTFLGDVRLGEITVTQPVALTIGQTILHFASTGECLEIPISLRGSFGDLLGQSLSMRQVFALLERVVNSNSTVLIEGESGTGKEVAAQSLHQLSSRHEEPLVVVDCGSIPPSLIESELFGHEKGAFTGAETVRIGALEEANHGTLFLDEIGELPLEMQPRLLRFLERHEVKRVGSSRPIPVDVRVIAATNRNLSNEVEAGRFRKDLYYRLSVVRVEMPPLKERPEDILLLAYHFAERYHPDPRTIVTDELAGLLTAYSWPGNIRELRNTIEKLAIIPELATKELQRGAREEMKFTPIGHLADLGFHEARRHWQDVFEKQYLSYQMNRAADVVTEAAKRAQLPRQTFHRLLRKHGLGRTGE